MWSRSTLVTLLYSNLNHILDSSMFLQGFLWGWLTWFDGDSVSSPVNGSYDTSIRVPLVCVLRAPFLVPFKRKKMSANKQIKNNDTISMLRSLLLASVPFKSIYLLGNPGCLLFIFTRANWLVHGLGKEQNWTIALNIRTPPPRLRTYLFFLPLKIG